MRTILPGRGRAVALWAFVLVLGAPALAEAQLFPNLPLRNRQRPDCAAENPQNKMIRQEYWGYYPTCWRKFPAGWGCPSADAPNWEQAKRERKLELPKDPNDDAAEGDGMDEGPAVPEGPATPDDMTLPELPQSGGSPFDQPPVKPATPPAGAAPNDIPPATPPGGTTASRPRRTKGLVASLLANRKR